MKVFNTKLKNVLLIKIDSFIDNRGEFIESYNEEIFKNNGIHIKFVQDDFSISRKNVLRGIHGDNFTWKLASCISGEIYLVIVDVNKYSPGFGKWESFNISSENRQQVLIPPSYGVAHLAITDNVIFHYKQSTYYDPTKQFTYKWNDPLFNIAWPIENPILSKRDELGKIV